MRTSDFFYRLRLWTILLTSFLPFSLLAVNHQVSVTSNVFNPSQLNINLGDTVTWTNTQGNHNVNGTQSTFPSNPASFGNDVGSGWTYSHVFTVAGTYDYQCDPHAGLGMTGRVVVAVPVTFTVNYSSASDALVVYPNPARTRITFEVPGVSGETAMAAIYSASGQRVYNSVLALTDRPYAIDISVLPAGS